jgi:hypothetical protein
MEFPRAREHAITAIDAYQGQYNSNGLGKLAPVRMIEMAKMYDVKKWLEPAYEVLAERAEVIAEEEAEIIGGRGVLVIMKAREKRRGVIRHMRVAPVDGDHPTEGNTPPRDDSHPPDVDSQESANQEDKRPGHEIHETAGQSSTDQRGSMAAFENSTDVEGNANFCSEMNSVVRRCLYRSELASC